VWRQVVEAAGVVDQLVRPLTVSPAANTSTQRKRRSRRLAGALASEPVVLCTQTANDRSMRLAAKLGFTEVERFEQYGAEQWFGVWSPVTPSG
jgi:hypothetical protein